MRTLLTAAALAAMLALPTASASAQSPDHDILTGHNPLTGTGSLDSRSGRQTRVTNTDMWRALNENKNPFAYTETRPKNRTIRAFAQARHDQRVGIIMDFFMGRDGRVTGHSSATINNCGNCNGGGTRGW